MPRCNNHSLVVNSECGGPFKHTRRKPQAVCPKSLSERSGRILKGAFNLIDLLKLNLQCNSVNIFAKLCIFFGRMSISLCLELLSVGNWVAEMIDGVSYATVWGSAEGRAEGCKVVLFCGELVLLIVEAWFQFSVCMLSFLAELRVSVGVSQPFGRLRGGVACGFGVVVSVKAGFW
jgi:hypothetical protein